MTATATAPLFDESSKVARVLGVSVETLRDWEKRGKIAPPLRTSSGRRLWTAADVAAIRAMRAGRKTAESPDAA